MFCFLKDRVEKLRSITNPNSGIILTHNTKKVSKKSLAEEPFQNFSGASALRSFYTSGIMMIKPNGEQSTRQLIFELRNGKSIPTMTIDKVNGSWSEKSTVKKRWKKNYDTILRLINEEGRKGIFYTKTQFCYFFEGKFGFNGCHSIRRYINALAAEGYIKFYEQEIPESNKRVKVMKLAEHLTRRDI